MRKQLNFLCTGNKIFVKYQAQGRLTPPLAYAHTRNTLFWEMHILSSFSTRHIDSLSLTLQKYLLWISLGFTIIVLHLTA